MIWRCQRSSVSSSYSMTLITRNAGMVSCPSWYPFGGFEGWTMRMKLCGAVADQVSIAPPPPPAVFIPLYYPLLLRTEYNCPCFSGLLDMNFAVWISFAITSSSSSSSTAEVWRRRSRAVRRGQTSTMIFFPWFLASQGLSWFASGLYRVIVLVLPTILRDLGRKSPKSLRTEYVSAFMVTCLGLIIAISLGYFTREDVLAVQIQEIRWATTFFGLGYATIGATVAGNHCRLGNNSFCVWQAALTRLHKQ